VKFVSTESAEQRAEAGMEFLSRVRGARVEGNRTRTCAVQTLDACNIPSTHTTQEHADSMQLAKINVVADSTGIRLPE
jgi:hypothetical protein